MLGTGNEVDGPCFLKSRANTCLGVARASSLSFTLSPVWLSYRKPNGTVAGSLKGEDPKKSIQDTQ
jgi:hypothetical protein